MAFYDEQDDMFEKIERATLRTAMVVLLIIGVVRILITELSSFKNLLDFRQILQLLPAIGIWVGVVAAMAVLMYGFVYILRKPRTRASSLKGIIIKTYVNALDKSSFNPQQLKEKSNEHKRIT